MVNVKTEETNPHASAKPIARPPPAERVVCSCGTVISSPPRTTPLTWGEDYPRHLTERFEVRGCAFCKRLNLPYIPPPIRHDKRVMDRLEHRNLDASNYRLSRQQVVMRIRAAWAHALDVTLATIIRYAEPLPESIRYPWHDEVFEKMDRAAHRARINIVAKVRGR